MPRSAGIRIESMIRTAPFSRHAGRVGASAKTACQRRPNRGEVALGFVGVPLGFAIGYTIGSGFRPHGSSNTGVALGFAGALVGPALGVSAVGSGGPVAWQFRRGGRRCGTRLRRAVLRGSRGRESKSNKASRSPRFWSPWRLRCRRGRRDDQRTTHPKIKQPHASS